MSNPLMCDKAVMSVAQLPNRRAHERVHVRAPVEVPIKRALLKQACPGRQGRRLKNSNTKRSRPSWRGITLPT